MGRKAAREGARTSPRRWAPPSPPSLRPPNGREGKECRSSAQCLAAERCWDQARWAIAAYAWRFDGLERAPRTGRSGLMLSIHPNARTTPAVRAEIARSGGPTGELAKRYGVSTETIRKWRKRGADDCRDRSSRPHKLPWKASEEERAVVCALRRATGFPLDDLTFVVRHFLPHLGRDNVYRILKAAGLSRRPASTAPEKPAGKFKEYELGFVHLDVKHLPKLRTAGGELRERFLFVAIDRRSRSVHLAVEDDETEASAKAFLEEAIAAFPFRVTHGWIPER